MAPKKRKVWVKAFRGYGPVKEFAVIEDYPGPGLERTLLAEWSMEVPE